MIAPVTLGDQVTTGAGSVITNDVESQNLALARSKQINIPGYQRPKKPRVKACVALLQQSLNVLFNQFLLEGLKRLEYRGYDSAGLATLAGDHIQRTRTQEKLLNLSRY